MEGDPQYAGGFVADLDARVTQLGSNLSQARDCGLGTRQAVGDAEGCDDFVADEFVHSPEGVDIRVDTQC
jgi:hypothetical protein